MSVDWPAWVQAIGSVLAILTAVALPRWDEHRRNQRRASDSAALMRFILAEVRRAEGLMEVALEGLTKEESIWSVQESVDNAARYTADGIEVLRKFTELPLGEWPDYDVGSAFFELLPAYRNMHAELRRKRNELIVNEDARREVRAFHAALMGQLFFNLEEDANSFYRLHHQPARVR